MDSGDPLSDSPRVRCTRALLRARVTIGESAKAPRENGFRRYGESYRTVEAQDDLSRGRG